MPLHNKPQEIRLLMIRIEQSQNQQLKCSLYSIIISFYCNCYFEFGKQLYTVVTDIAATIINESKALDEYHERNISSNTLHYFPSHKPTKQ